jgi:hypothetical protein
MNNSAYIRECEHTEILDDEGGRWMEVEEQELFGTRRQIVMKSQNLNKPFYYFT